MPNFGVSVIRVLLRNYTSRKTRVRYDERDINDKRARIFVCSILPFFEILNETITIHVGQK